MLLSILLISFLSLLAVGAPIAVALGTSAVIILFFFLKLPLIIVTQTMFTAVDSFSYMALPFFMLAGAFMSTGGVTRRIVDFASAMVGALTGGLALVVAISGMFFAALSGSSAATTAAIGIALIDEMESRGYKRDFAAAVVAAGGTVGIVIPPSITMVVYGVVAGVSIGDMFLGGFVPGIIMGLSMCLVSYFISKKHGYGGKGKTSLRNILVTFKDCIWALLMPVIIIGGIYGGIFTPTESAAVAAVYGMLIGLFVYKELKFSDLPKVILNAALSTAMIMFVISAANLFGWILTSAQIPHHLAAAFTNMTSNPIYFLMLVNVLLLFIGTLINASAAVVILVPILLPVVTTMGIDPVFFGVMMVVNLAIGCITPPVGLDLFVVSSITKLPIERITQRILPYLAVLIADLLVITYVPDLILIVPKILGS